MKNLLLLVLPIFVCISVVAQPSGNTNCQEEVGYGCFIVDNKFIPLKLIDRDISDGGYLEYQEFSDGTILKYRVRWFEKSCGYELIYIGVKTKGDNISQLEGFMQDITVLIDKQSIQKLEEESSWYKAEFRFGSSNDDEITIVFDRVKCN